MGAGAGGYVNIQLITSRNDLILIPGSLVRTSRLIFAPAETPKRTLPPIDPNNPGPPPGDPPAGKVALGGLTNAEVSKFNLYAYTDKARTSLTGMGTAIGTKANDKIAAEAQAAFGGDWAGFPVALGPAGGRFDLVADIVFKPRWAGQGAAKPFQIVPVVMAFGTDSFTSHYLLSLIVAQRTPELVDTAVTQPYR